MNPNYEAFANSVEKAFQEEVKPAHILILLLFIVGSFSFGFLLSFFYLRRRRIRRALTHYLKRFTGSVTADSRRFDLEAPLAIILPFSNMPTKRTATVNLSTGGMYIKTKEPFEERTSFQFILELPPDDRVDGTALVRWVQTLSDRNNPAGMGVEFLQLSERDKNKIRVYLKRRRWKRNPSRS